MQLHHVGLHIRVRAVLVAVHIIVVWKTCVAAVIVEVLQFVREPVPAVVVPAVRQHTTVAAHLLHVVIIMVQILVLMTITVLLLLVLVLPVVAIHQVVVRVPAVVILQAVVEVLLVQVGAEAVLPAEAVEEDK